MAQRKNNQADPAKETEQSEAETTQAGQQPDPDTNDTKNPDQPDPDATDTGNPDPDASSPEAAVTALALVDNATHGLTCGFVCEVPADVAEQLEKDGVIDRNEKAIASGRQPAEGND